MTMFETLPYEQQFARLADAAEHILPQFGLSDAEVTPLMYINNAVFAVDHRSGQYALRLHRRDHKRAEWIDSEMRWLADIRAQTDLCVPRPIHTQDGSLLAAAQVAGLDAPLNCVLMTWVDGDSCPPEDITPAQAARIGAFLAQLHNFSAGYAPPVGFARPRLDWEGLFGARSPYNPGDGAQIFQPDQIAVMNAVADRVRQVMQRLDEDDSSVGLIHADLIAKNMLFAGDHVCAIDFDDCAFGYYLYDMAPVLLQYSPLPGYADLKAALWAGYTTLRPLSAHCRDDLETFVAGRHVASMRWIAGNLHNPRIRERAPQILIDRTDELRDFLATGVLARKSEIF
jgi:Ser/Thr protein kinase RdoA (MazF antagonist)